HHQLYTLSLHDALPILVAFSERDLRNLFKDLDKDCNVEIMSKRTISDESVRETFPVSTATLLGKLTSRQLQALVMALDNGYYNIDRKSTRLNSSHVAIS